MVHENLPAILGAEFMRRFDLETKEHGFYRGYDSSIDPAPANEFATAAFRFGHTLIHERIRRTDERGDYDESLMLSMAFRRPGPVYDTRRGGVDSLLRGMVEQPCQQYDQFFTKQISKSLFTEKPPFGEGMDLISLNIQRSRNHGLIGYNDYRVFCGLKRAHSFEDLAGEMKDVRARRMLQKIYKHPDDIDLFAGGVSESIVTGGSVGPTFACLFGDTFRNAKKGGRFWYENDHKAGFSPAQLQEIRKVRLSRAICENSDNIGRIQPNVFFQTANDYVPSLNQIDEANRGGLWFENPSYTDDYAYFYGGDPRPQYRPIGFDDLAKQHPVLDQLPQGVAYNVRVPCGEFPALDLRKWREGPYTGDF